MEKFDGDLIPQRRLLNIVGIWPKDIDCFSSCVRFLLAMIVNISCICSLLVALYRQCTSVDDLTDALSLTVTNIIIGIKLPIYRMKLNRLRVLVDSVIADWSAVKDPRHERVMTDFSRRGKTVFSAFLYMFYVTGPALIIRLNSFDKLMTKQIMNYFGDSTRSSNGTLTLDSMSSITCIYGATPWYTRILIVMLQTLHITVLVMVQCGGDSWFFSLTMHLCGQFKILRMNLEEIKFDELDGREKLSILVKRHCYLIGLTDNLEQCFSNIILLQLLTSILIMCLCGFVFLVSLEIGDNIGVLRTVLFIITLLLQLYLFAYAGDVLESEAESVANAAYSLPWYHLSGHAARDLMLIINRGQISCQVTAGKFSTMNHFTFKEALKASASSLSVLRVMMKT